MFKCYITGLLITALLVACTPSQINPPAEEITNQGEIFEQTAMPTIFAPTPHPPTVTLHWARANPELLRLNLTISGLELVANVDDLENVVCDPYLNPDEPVSLTFHYREAKIPDFRGDPIELIYEYEMDASEYESLSFNMDLTIGPCANYLNFQETNVKSSSPLPDLIANYHLSFSVPVE
jgi:hypothetical protein